MKTTVIIPAYNEARCIGAVLDRLPRDYVEPIVAVNGSTDATAKIADSYGATVYNIEQRGKLPAIQESLRRLGDRALLPILLLDGDTRPMFPKYWHSHMLKALQPESDVPMVVGAPIWFVPNNEGPKSSRLSATLRSVNRQMHGLSVHPRIMDKAAGAYYGPNQGFKLANSKVLGGVLELPHIWPKEDLAFADTITGNGGQYVQLIDPTVIATSPESASFSSLLDYVHCRLSKGNIGSAVTEAYRRNAPVDSVSYEEYKK